MRLVVLTIVAGALSVAAPNQASAAVEEFNYTGLLETFTVPPGVTSVRIIAVGAKGGNGSSPVAVGHGASIQGEFSVSAGDILTVLVGGVGQSISGLGGGGGGGSFVWRGSGFGALDLTSLLVAAGGGGGSGGGFCSLLGTDASVGPSGTAGNRGGAGGQDGGGGGAGSGSISGAGGGGISGNGASEFSSAFGGQAISSGASGGSGESIHGGFGGGGAGWNGGGGGGGFSGGGGGDAGFCNGGGGGGGSYNAGTSPVNTPGVGTGDGQVTIEFTSIADNQPPVVSAVAASPNPLPVGTAVGLTATLDDAATGGSAIASAAYTLDGGAAVAMDAVDGAFDDEATEDVRATIPAFAAAGVHDVCVSGTDAAANPSAPACVLVAVYDPAAGYVTGGGSIHSPAGAYPADESLEGPANFAFVSRYQRGATVPAGTTQFRFKAASLDFRSTRYDWLVISGPKAQYKGSGTINGTGDYGFLLTANDGAVNGGGGVDALRVKIWDKATGAVVYDNQGGADTNPATDAIEGGSIVIHK